MRSHVPRRQEGLNFSLDGGYRIILLFEHEMTNVSS